MSEQPPEQEHPGWAPGMWHRPGETDAEARARRNRARLGHRLATAAVTAREDPAMVRTLIQQAVDDMGGQGATVVAKMLAGAFATVVVQYVGQLAAYMDRAEGPGAFDAMHRARVNHAALEDEEEES